MCSSVCVVSTVRGFNTDFVDVGCVLHFSDRLELWVFSAFWTIFVCGGGDVGSTYLKMYWKRPPTKRNTRTKKVDFDKVFFYSYDFSHILHTFFGLVLQTCSIRLFGHCSNATHTHIHKVMMLNARKFKSISITLWRTLRKMQMIMTKNCRPHYQNRSISSSPIATATDKFLFRFLVGNLLQLFSTRKIIRMLAIVIWQWSQSCLETIALDLP